MQIQWNDDSQNATRLSRLCHHVPVLGNKPTILLENTIDGNHNAYICRYY